MKLEEEKKYEQIKQQLPLLVRSCEHEECCHKMFNPVSTDGIEEEYGDGPFRFKWNSTCLHSHNKFGTFLTPMRKHMKEVHGLNYQDKNFPFEFLKSQNKKRKTV